METILTKELQGGIGCAWDAGRGRLVIAEWSGALVTVEDGRRTVLGRGYTKLEDVVLSADGRFAVVTERGGDVLLVPMSRPNRDQARVLASGLDAPHQLALDERHRFVHVVEFGRRGRLLRVPLKQRRRRPGISRLDGTTVVASGLTGGIGLVLDRAGTTAYVSRQTRGAGRVEAVTLRTGATRVVHGRLTNPFMMTWKDDSQTTLLVCERAPANRVVEVPVRTLQRPPVLAPGLPGVPRIPGLPPIAPRRPGIDLRTRPPRVALQPGLRVVSDGVGAQPSSVVRRDGDSLLVCADSQLTLLDLRPQPSLRVEFELDPEPMFVGAFQRVGVRVIGAGASWDDLEFDVPGIANGCAVSQSHDDTFDPAAPTVLVRAGYEPGPYTLRARHRGTGAVLGEATFEVTTRWHRDEGPPMWFEGITQSTEMSSTWGGGSSGPQNADIHPASGTRRVAMIFVDTATQRYPADPSATITEWTDETFNGVDVGGKTTSVHHWFQEVSRGAFGLENAGVVGPVSLDGQFEEYFEHLEGTRVWRFKTNFVQAAVTAADDLLDLTDVDSVIFVVQTAPAEDPTSMVESETKTRFAWPYGWGTTVTTEEGNVAIKTVVMPADWEGQDSRELYETLTHELGHNLGLPDIYTTDDHGIYQTRDVGGWDSMSAENRWSHFSSAFKLRLGWMDGSWVKAYDFQGSGAVDETVTLRASEAGAPQSGEFSAIEIRIADGWNYYFEYRKEQGAQIGSQQLPTDGRVLGTDVISDDYTAPSVRRHVHMLPNDPDGDGPVLGTGQDYEETDVSDPMFPTDFQFDVVNTAGDTAEVRVRYGANSRPDPSIRPWPGSGANAWQSPDIEVRNDRNAADPELRNVPWAGHPNTIVAKVRNAGSLLAQGVQVRFGVKDYTVGGGAETPLGTRTVDIPAGDTVEVEFDGWVPPGEGHYCVTVRLPLHVESGPPVVIEQTELNNNAQSNYSQFITDSESPATRARTFFTVGNPYPERTRVFLEPKQTNPFFRTYVETTSVTLDPGEERKVEIMFEAVHGTHDEGMVMELFPEHRKDRLEPNIVNLSATIEDPRDPEADTPEPLGGLLARVRWGHKTRVTGGLEGDEHVFGRVTTSHPGGVDSGIVIISSRPLDDPTAEVTTTAPVRDGRFTAKFSGLPWALRDEGIEVRAEYLGGGELAPSPSTVLHVTPRTPTTPTTPPVVGGGGPGGGITHT